MGACSVTWAGYKRLERTATPSHVSLLQRAKTSGRHPSLIASASEKASYFSILNSKLVIMVDPLASDVEDLLATCPVSCAFYLILALRFPFLTSFSLH